MSKEQVKDKTRWLKGAHTFGTTDVNVKVSGRVQGRAAVLTRRSADRLALLMEKGVYGDRLAAPERPRHYKEKRWVESANSYANKTNVEKITFVKNCIKKLKKEFKSLQRAPQRRRALMGPTILKQIDSEEIKLTELIQEVVLGIDYESMSYAQQQKLVNTMDDKQRSFVEEVKSNILNEEQTKSKVQFAELINDSVVEIRFGDLSEFKKGSKKQERGLGELTPSEYMKLVEAQNNEIEID